MNSKLTLPDLIAALSDSANVSRSLSERFIKALFSIVADTVINGENIKIKGLGTFKVSDVEERKSVNVNTGAEMIIPAHRKISFSPDKSLSEMINAPFSLFEAVELDDEVSEQMLAQADEPSVNRDTDVMHDHSTSTTDDSTVISIGEDDNYMSDLDTAMEEPADDMQSCPKDEIETDKAQDACASIGIDENTRDQEASSLPPDSDESCEAAVIATSSNAPETKTHKPHVQSDLSLDKRENTSSPANEEVIANEKKVEIHVHSPECHAPHFRRGIYLGIIAAASAIFIIIAGWRLLLPESFCFVTNTAIPQSQSEIIAKTAIPATPVKENLTHVDADSISHNESIQPTVEESSDEGAAPTQASDAQKSPESAKVYDTITRKRFLTTMAKEHYGNYNLWPFIYDENRDHLGHPDRIKPGTKVVIPPASKYNIDANDPKCVARAKKRGTEIYAKYK